MRRVRVQIDDEGARALRRGRPWVYREAVRDISRCEPGAWAEVVDRQGAFVGAGLCDPDAAIAVRVLTRDAAEGLGPALLARRIEAALALRQRVLDLREVTAWRLCNGEGDRLPGLAIDVYGPYCVLELSTAAWTPHRELVIGVLSELLAPAGVVEKSRLRPGRGGEVVQHLAGEEPPEELIVREGPASFAVTLRGTTKSGLFLDQRDTRAALRRLCDGCEVLNAFCSTGSLSVAAAQAGARRVSSLDLSRRALSRAKRNFEVNGLDPGAHEWLAGDAFEELPALERSGRRFDAVILDPPAFATSKRRVFQAERDWRDLAALGIRLLRPRGLLVASSPMAALPLAAFERALAGGAQAAGTSLRVFDLRIQPADHPVDPACPERRHLKTFFAVRG